jgi:hypothetical protein
LIYFDVAARDYGGSYLFSFYLAEQFGTQFLSDLIQHEDDGARGIETALDEAGYNITFNQLYLDWITALTINELGFDDNKYGFQNLDVKIEDITVVDDIPFVSESMDVWCYGSNIFELAESPNGFTITTGIPSSGKIGLSVAYHDVDGWHVTQEISTVEITENVHGNNIDSAYVIVTYFYASTPAGSIDFGIGVTEDISFSISDYTPPTNPDWSNTTSSITPVTTPAELTQILVFGLGSLGITAAVIVLYIKKKNVRT